jgi:hypothetical protein
MKKLDKKSFEEIRNWVYRNARPMELAIWQYEFEDGSRDAVLTALSFYQNEDGGFGNALEADCWNPNSSPYTTLNAISKLKEINFTDRNHPIIQGIFKFIESGMHYSENGWLFNIPSNNDYPHAPWWTYDSESNEYESIGVTAGIACFLLRFADKDASIYKQALSIVDKLIAKLSMPGNFGEMGVGGYCELLETIPQLGLSDRYDMDFVANTVKRLVYDAIERDIAKWVYYGKTPSSFITSPDSIFYKENEALLHQELDYIIEKRPENGVWGITWSWFDLNEVYPKEFAISENWWKADVAIGKLKLLRNFDRVE